MMNGMVHSFNFPDLSFRWSWRPYQQRVLDAVQDHLSDDRLHVVAAPGAGKTTLGLEVFRQLGHPALVLSPTRGIRDQWVDRLSDFVPEGASFPPDWVSTRLDDPRIFTSITYQALHTDVRESEEEADPESPSAAELSQLKDRIQEAGIQTLILDEAHHLRQEWWKALDRLLQNLPEVKVVALTATPPYDVTGAEWKKYSALCGPIDEEISIPELVRSGTLCPHQDFVWMVEPRATEKQQLKEHDQQVEHFLSEFAQERVFRDAVCGHSWISRSDADAAELLEHPEEVVGLVLLLREFDVTIPRFVLRTLGIEEAELPEMDRRWWQVVVYSYLFGTHWPDSAERDEHVTEWKKRLRGQGLLSRRDLRIQASRPHMRALSLSPAKIDGVVEIYRRERTLRGPNLRQVVLTDFIRDDDLKQVVAAEPALGAWPVFRTLVTQVPPEESRSMALLTGRVVLLHEEQVSRLQERLGEEVICQPVPGLPSFVEILCKGKPPIAAYTAMLCDGDIQVLVGTRSLLGEGWDAPVINSLVLASYVGSYMLTNQMRGRAIRIDRNTPEKASSIWHLVAVDSDSENGRADLEDLERKCGTFVGLDSKTSEICNGLDRLHLPHRLHPVTRRPVWDLELNHQEMSDRLASIDLLADRWASALEGEGEERVVPGVAAEPPLAPRRFVMRRTLRAAVIQALESFLMVTAYQLQVQTRDLRSFLWLLLGAATVGFLWTLPTFIRLLILAVRHAPVDGSLKQIGRALRDALCETDLLPGPPQRYPVQCEEIGNGEVALSLGNADFYEQSLYADCLNELLGAVENPRYLLTRKDRFSRRDYHAVPAPLGRKKELAAVFHRFWKKRLGPADLIYTRTPETRAMLLQARVRAFSTAMTPKSQRVDRWM